MSASSALASPARRRSSSDRSASSPCITRECTTRAENPGWLLAALLEKLGDEAGPARLVARADAGAGVAVEVLVEEDQVAPVGVALELLRPAVDRAPTVPAPEEDPREPSRELGGHLPEVEHPAGARRAGDLHAVAVEMVAALERLDQEIVHREPDRPPPVRVAAEEPARGLGGLVVDPVLRPVQAEHVRVVLVEA